MTDISDLLAQMRAHGIDWANPTLDGKIHRFGKNKKQWAIGWQNHTIKGEIYIVAQYGDWSLGETFDFKTTRRYSKEEKSNIDRQIKDAQQQQRDEKEKLQKEAREYADKLWTGAGSDCADSDYLRRKGLRGLCGARSYMHHRGRTLLVPTRTIDGGLAGLQRIFPDGAKKFLPGQEVRGTFFQIGDVRETIYVCEGFATAATIHEATSEAVFCAFNSGNLSVVCSLLKAKYPDCAFVVCADNDLWTVKPDGTPWNPGREAGEETARLCLGSLVLPVFQDTTTKPTDFNDLMNLEGIEAVRSQLQSVQTEKHFVKSLGYRNDSYFYTTSSNKQIVKVSVSGHSKSGLLNLMPLTYWETLYPKKNGGFDVDLATNDLMCAARVKGIFDESLIRGVGVWPSCINLGDALWIDGKKQPFSANNSKYIYEIGRAIPAPDAPALQKDGTLILQEAVAALPWGRSSCCELFLGWLALAPLAGALQWRPHVWLTGPSGTGKSYIMNNLVHKILPFLQALQGSTSEAGLRQKTGTDSVPVIFDEFETDDEKSGDRVKSILELFRQASSETDGQIVKGTPSGNTIEYMPRFCALVSSIRVNLTTEADRNRFTVCELVRGGNSEQFARVKSTFRKLDREFALKLYSRMYSMLPVIRQNIELLSEIIGDQYNQRFGQQYGTLLAGYAALNNDGVLSHQEAQAIVANAELEGFADVVEDTDEVECDGHLFNTVVRVETGNGMREYTLAGLLQEAMKLTSSPVAPGATWLLVKALADRGICFDHEHVYVASRHPELSKIFRGTKWQGGWAKSLGRIAGSENNIQKWMDRRNFKCTKIAISSIISST